MSVKFVYWQNQIVHLGVPLSIFALESMGISKMYILIKFNV